MRQTGFCASEWLVISNECGSCSQDFAPEWRGQEHCADCLADAASDAADAENERQLDLRGFGVQNW